LDIKDERTEEVRVRVSEAESDQLEEEEMEW